MGSFSEYIYQSIRSLYTHCILYTTFHERIISLPTNLCREFGKKENRFLSVKKVWPRMTWFIIWDAWRGKLGSGIAEAVSRDAQKPKSDYSLMEWSIVAYMSIRKLITNRLVIILVRH